MGLFGKIGRTADDIVFPVFDLADKSSSFLIKYNLNTIAHCDRIGAANPFQSEITLDFTFDRSSVIGFHLIPTTRVFDY